MRRSRRFRPNAPADYRGRRVVLVSHCLLNQNTRYAGGATRAGAVVETVDALMEAGLGIHQLPCPERLAWGGVDKPQTLRMYGSRGSVLHALRRPLLRGFLAWTRHVYRQQARLVARDVADYRRADVEVVGFVGIGGSPSCGVTTTLDLAASLEVVAACPLAQLTRETMNEQVVLSCRRPGRGLFVEQLDRALLRRGIAVPAWEHDLALELQGIPQPPLIPSG